MKIQRFEVRSMPNTVIDLIRVLVSQYSQEEGRKLNSAYVLSKAVCELAGMKSCPGCSGIISLDTFNSPPEYNDANKSIWREIEKEHTTSCTWVKLCKQNKIKRTAPVGKSLSSNVIDVGTGANPDDDLPIKIVESQDKVLKEEFSIGESPEGFDGNPMLNRLAKGIKSKNIAGKGLPIKRNPPKIRTDEPKNNDGLPEFIKTRR